MHLMLYQKSDGFCKERCLFFPSFLSFFFLKKLRAAYVTYKENIMFI